MIRVARTALLAPVMVVGGFLTLTLGSTSVFAAGSTATSGHAATAVATPQTSSRPHKHERVDCSPGHVAQDGGQCRVTFVDKATKFEKNPVGQHVCFTVSPAKAGAVGTGAGHCAVIGSNDKAFGTFTASGKYCGPAVITATETGENSGQAHHTTVQITCAKTATATAALLPAGSPVPPAGGWLLGLLGVGIALVTGYAIRTRRWFSPRRLAANQSA
jgi:hypothetical protein